MRISAKGGTPEFLLKAESESLASPQILPGGKSVLFTDISLQPPRIVVQSLKPREHNELFAGDTACYLPTGQIVYASGNDLLAVPFDPCPRRWKKQQFCRFSEQQAARLL